jgi:histidyl-tRNA synthetase
MGQSTDVVQKQMLTLQSQKQGEAEDLGLGGYALRPEGTAAIVRSYIENSLDKSESLSKFFYLGPMFRGERPQKGRLRQFHQIGVEAIGPQSGSAYLDAEVISLSVQLLKGLGLSNFKLKINTLGTAENKKAFVEVLRKKISPERENLCKDCQDRLERNVLRILDCKNEKCRSVVGKINIGREWLSKDSLEYFEHVKSALSDLNVVFQEDPRLVRGLDYYTHTVFEISDPSLGSQDALGAGGRYNRLVSELGGPEVDAVGFALGIERIILALESKKKPYTPSIDVCVISLDEKYIKNAFILLNDIRHEGLSADMNYQGGSMKSQMRYANKLGARYVIILGEDEIKNKEIALKNMHDGTQEKVAFNNVKEKLSKLKEKG